MVSILRTRSKEATYKWFDRILSVVAALVFYFYWWKGDGNGGTDVGMFFTEQKQCAPQKGLVVVNFLDYLGWNLLQIGFARRLGEELCWDVTYRTMWKTGFNSNEDETCFADALTQPTNPGIQQELGIDDALWTALNFRAANDDENYESHNEKVKEWAIQMANEGKAWRCISPTCDFSEQHIQDIMQKIRTTPSVRVVYLESFFSHYEWIEAAGALWRNKLRKWLKIGASCCTQQPPEDAVVIHIQKENDDKLGNIDMPAVAYDSLLGKYGLKKKPLWIVCEDEDSKNLPVVESLKAKYKGTVVVPKTASDTYCTLMRARNLVLTPNSMISIVAGGLNSQAEIQMIVPKDGDSRYMLNMTGWKYHLFEGGKITDWDVDHRKLPLHMPWDN